MSSDPQSCVVLVPVGGTIDPGCDDALRELEKRGYTVWRYRGYSAVDAGRNQLASDALGAGFTEFMWIDTDVAFDPGDVERLRDHHVPMVCGLYAKKGPRQIACEFFPNTPAIRFGTRGGLIEVRYCGFGFTIVQKEVFTAIHYKLKLPICNRRFGTPLVPFFEPVTVPDPGGAWSLSEDYAFCERARRCGFRVMADTSIRLWHVGPYRYGWEDAGSERGRQPEYIFHLPGSPPGEPIPAPSPQSPSESEGFTQDWFTDNIPTWEKLLGRLKGQACHALEVGVFEGRSAVWLLENILTHPEATLTWVDTFAGGADHDGMDLAGLETRFRANTSRFGAKLNGQVGRSQDVLRHLAYDQFDLIYLDGSHEAADVLTDAVLAWPLLKVGGLLGFDDYGWRRFPDPERCPGLAIDAFRTVLRGRYEELHRDYQVWMRKIR